MTAQQAVAYLRRLGPYPHEHFLYLASHVHEARLADGSRVMDATDFAAWLIELADVNSPLPKLDPTCPRCGHTHEGENECGTYLGGQRFCRCELEVPA
jgi:hypothetical protein